MWVAVEAALAAYEARLAAADQGLAGGEALGGRHGSAPLTPHRCTYCKNQYPTLPASCPTCGAREFERR